MNDGQTLGPLASLLGETGTPAFASPCSTRGNRKSPRLLPELTSLPVQFRLSLAPSGQLRSRAASSSSVQAAAQTP
eukprot:1536575-Lingulodinium_polyedra.AAC.1